jgi:hypothetical protein
MLFLYESWWRCMRIMMDRASLYQVSAKLVHLARSDIRTRSVFSIDKSIANLGLGTATGQGRIDGVALTRLRHALVIFATLKTLI